MEKDEIAAEVNTEKVEIGLIYNLSLRAVNPVDVSVKDLSLDLDTTPPVWTTAPSQVWRRFRGQKPESNVKRILDEVSAEMSSGSLTAILGSSGSGKTSLLNLMAGRMSLSKAQVSGSTTFNGNANIESVRCAYVMQEDVLIPTLTVRETLRYSADLRLPPPTTQEERHAIVEQVILELGLKECADTRIGTNAHKGCSGGEKRRTSIGVQLLANPSILFCDEPTTGLDATSAFQIMRTLKRLAQDGRTVVVSIHAPRSETWTLFDNLIILARGSALYSGPASEALPHFEKCGHVMPPFVNPAEFLIDLAAIDNRTSELEAASYARVENLRTVWRTEHRVALTKEKTNMVPIMEDVDTGAMKKVSFRRQLNVLTSRTFITTIRDPMGVAGSLLEAVGMAVINGWIFLQLGETQAGIRSREGSLYTASSLNGYLILLYETYRLTIDIRLFDRERNEGVVSVPAFLLSRRVARFPLEDLPVPLLFSLIFYFMVGYRLDAGQFFIFFALTLLTHYIAVTFAAVAIGVSRNFPGASLVANLSFTLQSFACGYFVQSNQIPVYVRWLKWCAYTFYIFGALCANEFMGTGDSELGHFYDCPYSNDPHDPACKEYTGKYIMNSLGFPPNWIWRPVVYNRFAIDIAQARKTEGDYSASKAKLTVRPSEEARKLTISLDQYALEIRKARRPDKEAQKLQILQPITAGFFPGELNIIMGPSGSGKTSLLSSIACRLHGSLGTQYHVKGQMLYNGAVPSETVIRSVTSFVTQDDDALMPSLTVRETDFVLDLITVDLQQEDREAITRDRVRHLISSWSNKTSVLNRVSSQIATPAELGSLRRQMLPFQVTFPLVLRRSFINFWRQPPLVMARSMQILGIAIIMALFFAPLKNDYAAVQSRMGFVQEFAALYFVGMSLMPLHILVLLLTEVIGMLQNIAIYPNERDVFYREEADNCYSAETFILAYTTIEVPFEIASALLFGVLAAFADNLKRTAEMFLISAFNCFCIISCGESVGIMFCTLFSHVGFAVNVTSILLSISTILGGVMSLNVNDVLQGINHLSPIKYSIANLAPYSMHGQEFHCSAAEQLADGSCPINNGEQVLQLYNLDKNGPMNIMALGVCTIIYRFVAYALLKLMRSERTMDRWREWRRSRRGS
ncbi:hypothetical protein N7488_001218 [Penicillium malachiteum]|nr:hypothetical protein N7488_001218 [Penicillium malachiteum]